MSIKWTSSTRQQLHGWRTPHKADPDDAVPTLAAAWAQLRTSTAALPAIGGSAADRAVAVLKSHEQAQPPATLTIDDEILRASLAYLPPATGWDAWESWSVARALVALWVEVGGFRFAVDLLSSAPAWTVGGARMNGVFVELNVSRDEGPAGDAVGPWQPAANVEPLWWALRLRVAALDDAALAAAVAACADLLGSVAGAAAWRRAMAVFVLSRDTTTSAHHIDRWLAAPGPLNAVAHLLVAAAPDVDRANAVMQRAISAGLFRFGVYGIDLVEGLGADAAGVLQVGHAHALEVAAARYLTAEAKALKLAQSAAPTTTTTKKKKAAPKKNEPQLR